MTIEGDRWTWRRVEEASPTRGWWRETGVHQNITFAVQPDPISGMQCWHQKVRVSKAAPGERLGDIVVDRAKARAEVERWKSLTRPAQGELRRPLWLPRSVRPSDDTYRF